VDESIGSGGVRMTNTHDVPGGGIILNWSVRDGNWKELRVKCEQSSGRLESFPQVCGEMNSMPEYGEFCNYELT
jgi:hypothetical protein